MAMTDKAAKAVAVLIQALSGAPLLFYPIVFVTNLMLLSGMQSGRVGSPWLETVGAYAFLAGTFIYPLVFLAFTVAAWRALRRGALARALRWSAAPLAYLVGIGVPFALMATH